MIILSSLTTFFHHMFKRAADSFVIQEFTEVKPLPAGLVSGCMTEKIYHFVTEAQDRKFYFNAQKCELSKVQILFALFMQTNIDAKVNKY